MCTTVKVTAR